jgi:hypothetical protein
VKVIRHESTIFHWVGLCPKLEDPLEMQDSTVKHKGRTQAKAFQNKHPSQDAEAERAGEVF